MIVGEVVGPFEIEKELGSGAMGTVYRARVTKSGQTVALKVIAFGLVGNEGALKRFEREANILKQLRHPNIVRLLATGTYRKTPFFAMEYIEGESLDRVQARRGRFTWEEVVEIGKQLADALQHAHEKGIVHRDLKPSNLMMMADGTVKLTDFGIAKDTDVTALTGANSTIGTAAYMSPEQCKGEKTLGPKSDIYSFGIVMYELLTGKKPFHAESAVDMFLLHVNGKFERPSRLVLDIPVWLDNLVCQMMEKKPEQRPLDAAMVGKVLREISEKVNTQKSVGVDVATARAVDKPRMNNPADETDREAAKSLRAASGKKKKGKKTRPPTFFEKKWVQATGILGFMLAAVVVIYFMTRPEKPEVLMANIDKLLAEGKTDAAENAVQNYLSIYGEVNDPNTERMRTVARSFEVARRESQLFNRYRKKMGPEDDDDRDAYETTMLALDAEAEGDRLTAANRWQKLATKAVDANNPAQKMWVDHAKRKLAALNDVARREARLRERLRDDLIDEKERTFDDEAERMSVEAIRFEQFGDLPRAKERWGKVRDASTSDLDKRPWFLLAASKDRELTEALKGQPKDEESAKRLANLQAKLAQAELLKTDSNLARQRDARNLWRDVRDLYQNDPDTKVAPFVQQAIAALRQAGR